MEAIFRACGANRKKIGGGHSETYRCFAGINMAKQRYVTHPNQVVRCGSTEQIEEGWGVSPRSEAPTPPKTTTHLISG